jgi:hypothetical protein
VLATLKIYGVPMFVNAVKMVPRFIMSLFFAVALTLLVFAVAGVSFLGVTLAVQGWAASPPTTIHAPTSP